METITRSNTTFAHPARNERRRDHVTRARVNHRVMAGIAAKLPDGPAKMAALRDVMRLAEEVSAAILRQATEVAITDGGWPDGYNS